MLVFMLIPSKIWRCGQVVKTLLFHGRIAGPTPASVTIWESRIAAIAGGCKPLALRLHRFESYLSHHFIVYASHRENLRSPLWEYEV